MTLKCIKYPLHFLVKTISSIWYTGHYTFHGKEHVVNTIQSPTLFTRMSLFWLNPYIITLTHAKSTNRVHKQGQRNGGSSCEGGGVGCGARISRDSGTCDYDLRGQPTQVPHNFPTEMYRLSIPYQTLYSIWLLSLLLCFVIT